MPSVMPRARISGLVTNTSSPTSWTREPSSCVSICPAAPVAFGAAVFDRDDRILAAPLDVERHHPLGIACRLAGLLELVARQPPTQNSLDATSSARYTSAPGAKAGLADRLEHHFERFAIRAQVRREAAFVADAGRQARASSECRAARGRSRRRSRRPSLKRRRADRHHHELLKVDVRIGVRAAVEDVHHRHRQQVARGVAGQVRDVRVEARARRGSRRP